MTEFPELRAALVAAAHRQRALAVDAAQPAQPSARPGPGGRWWRPVSLRAVLLALAALLVIAAVALAAVGVFGTGRPVAPVQVPNPHASDGAVIASTIRVLPLGVADPEGGPRWGLRILRTTRGEVCVTPGRVQDGVIGVLGRDGAFGNDGRLHPFARDYIAPGSCALSDADGHAFLSIGLVGLPSSALLAPEATTAAGGCRVDNPPPANRKLLCPTHALRDVYFGLLGPRATSVTYTDVHGIIRTMRTEQPDGAYLVVLPYRGGLQGNASIGTGLSELPFLSVSYTGGYTCRVSQAHPCQPVGYHPAAAASLTAAQLRAPVDVRVVRAHRYCNSKDGEIVIACNGTVPHGDQPITGAEPFVIVNIRFTARVAITDSHSYYELAITYPKSPSCTIGGTSGPTDTDIHAGQRILMQEFVPLSCPGTLHGAVRYVPSDSLGPAGLPPSTGTHALTVARFVIST